MKANRQSGRSPVIFLAFANEHNGERLVHLDNERKLLQEALRPLEDEELCRLVIESSATLNDISNGLTRYGDRIAVFHFAGHAGPENLRLETGDGGSTEVHAGGFAQLLSVKRPPDIVFLNGCSSADQAEQLLDLGVLAVIGTTEAIDDEIATRFSGLFYRNLAAGSEVHSAFAIASKHHEAEFATDRARAYRALYHGKSMTKEWPWELHTRPESRDRLANWSLAKLQNTSSPPRDTTLLGYMCDRKDQVEHFFEVALPQHAADYSKRPLGLIVHGETRQAHEQFIQRLGEWDLPHYLHRQSPREQQAPVTVLEVEWKNNLDALRSLLAEQLTGHPDASPTEMHEALVEMRVSTIIKTSVFTTDWRASTPEIIESWIALFSDFGDLPSGQLLVPVVLLYEKPTLLDRLPFFKSTPSNFIRRFRSPSSMYAGTLPRLESVPMTAVTDEWLKRDFEKQIARLAGDLEIGWSEIVIKLRPFVKELYKEEGLEALPMEDLGDKLAAEIQTILNGA